jgi:hypothetical protein
MTRRCVAALAFAVLLPAISSRASAQSRQPTLDSLLALAAVYEQRFESTFRSVLGSERFQQRVGGFGRDDDGSSRRRIIESETLFLRVPEEQSWLMVRNVRRVDGRTVPDSDGRLDRLLADTSGDWLARVRRLRDEGARFDLGKIRRNFSDPTMVLQFVNPAAQRRFRFELRGREHMNGREVWRVAYAEQERPTLVQSSGRDVAASGDLWIEPAGGVVVRTRVTLRDTLPASRLTAAIDVTFRPAPRFDVWMPARMEETYEERGRGMYRGQLTTFAERVDCVATYSNFRRFETDARIVQP